MVLGPARSTRKVKLVPRYRLPVAGYDIVVEVLGVVELKS